MPPPVILLVDDCEDDVFIFRRCLTNSQVSCSLQRLPDGHRAIEYLQGSGEYADRAKYPLPAVLLLDCHLPKVSGLEVLTWCREQDQFKSLPVVILSGSSHPGDEERARQLGVTRMFQKNLSCQEVVEYLRSLLAAPRA